MLQNIPYWKAKECVNKRGNCDYSLFTFPSGFMPLSFALQFAGFCTM